MSVGSDRRGDFLLSTDRSLLDASAVHAFLARSYWAQGIPLDVVRRSIENSIPFAIYHAPAAIPPRLAAFARVITDRATFAYVGDVFVLEEFRGRGLSKWLMDAISAHPELQDLRLWLLLTRDAHGLYERQGFSRTGRAEWIMEKRDPDVYKRLDG
jgi:GNAT superfamily N-acetyltransferase